MPVSTQIEAFEANSLTKSSTSTVQPGRLDKIRAYCAASEDEIAQALLIVLVPVVILESIFRSVSKGLWFDEILTKFVSGQPNVSGIWNLLTHGVDGHPPGIYLIEHFVGRLGGNERIVFRLPSIAAFVCVMLIVYSFVKRRMGGMIAFISAAALLLTTAFDPFAFEARSYGVMLACIAVAVLCYEKADSKKWAVFFALALAAGVSMHFYASLAFFPFGLAELTLWYTERKFRPQVWLAFVVGALPILAFWPILNAQRVLFGAHFWATPTFWNFAKSLGEVLRVIPSFSFGIYAAGFLYLLYLGLTGEFNEKSAGVPGRGFTLPEVALTLGFLAMPVVTYAVAKATHGALSGRYLTTTTLGISLGLSLILSRLKKPAVLSIGVFILCMFVFQEGAQWRFVFRPREVKDLMEAPSQLARQMDVPVVISNGLVYLPAWRQGNDEYKSRLVFLADPDEQIAASGSDTTTRILMVLKDYLPIHVQTFSEFSQAHRKFLLFSNGDAQDYWPRWLVERGYSARAIAVEPSTRSIMEYSADPPKSILFLVDLDQHN
jgi:hypothetical protein